MIRLDGARRFRAGLAVVALSTLALTGCHHAPGLSSEGQALSIEQSEQLAQARFQLSTVDTFTASVSAGSSDATDHYAADLTVDTSKHQAWGTLHRGPAKLAVDQPVMLDATRLATLTDGTWRVDASQGSEFSALPITLSLVADRPENAQLLRQSGARYLGSQDLDGTELGVYRLPADDGGTGQTRLWLNDAGQLKRLDNGAGTLTIDLTGATPEPRPAAFAEVLPPSDAQDGK